MFGLWLAPRFVPPEEARNALVRLAQDANARRCMAEDAGAFDEMELLGHGFRFLAALSHVAAKG